MPKLMIFVAANLVFSFGINHLRCVRAVTFSSTLYLRGDLVTNLSQNDALGAAKAIVDHLAGLGSSYQELVEVLMFTTSEMANLWEGDEDDDNSEAVARAPGRQLAYESALSEVAIEPVIDRLRVAGFDAAVAAVADMREAVVQVISAVDVSVGLDRVRDNGQIELVFKDLLKAHTVACGALGAGDIPAESVADTSQPNIRPFSRAIVRDDSGRLLAGPLFPSPEEADTFIEQLAIDLRNLADSELVEIAPRTFRPPYAPGEDYPGRDEWIWLFSVSTVELVVGTMVDVVDAWKADRLYDRQDSLSELYNQLIHLAGYGGFF